MWAAPLLSFEGPKPRQHLRPCLSVFCPRHPKKCLGGFTDQDLGTVLDSPLWAKPNSPL